jgi:hypothetical protein
MPVSVGSFKSDPPPIPDEIIPGLLRRGDKALLTAGSKARKTWMLLGQALSIATGLSWLGRPTLTTGVLYLNFELHPHSFWHRAQSIHRAYGLSKWPENLWVQNLRGHSAKLLTMHRPLVDFCKEQRVGLIIADPFYKLGEAADELSTEAIGEFLNRVEAIASEAEAAVEIAHHHTKGDSSGKALIDLASGTGVFARDPDLIMGLRELKESTPEQPAFQLEFLCRDFPPAAAIGIRWEYPLWKADSTLDLELKPAKPGRPAETTVTEILQVLGQQEITVSEWCSQCIAELGVSDRNFKALKAVALKRGFIAQRPQGRNQLVTAAPKPTGAETEQSIPAQMDPLFKGH